MIRRVFTNPQILNDSSISCYKVNLFSNCLLRKEAHFLAIFFSRKKCKLELKSEITFSYAALF